jgi:uncharacterized protein YjbI with pentapeptide repeats
LDDGLLGCEGPPEACSEPQTDPAVLTLARARTATVVQRLDADRNQDVMRFLGETNLLGDKFLRQGDFPSISLLAGTDLRGTDLKGVVLPNANLSTADLRDADLTDADLGSAVLRDADLRGADLTEAKGVSEELVFQGTKLEGATVPDGSKHP